MYFIIQIPYISTIELIVKVSCKEERCFGTIFSFVSEKTSFSLLYQKSLKVLKENNIKNIIKYIYQIYIKYI